MNGPLATRGTIGPKETTTHRKQKDGTHTGGGSLRTQVDTKVRWDRRPPVSLQVSESSVIDPSSHRRRDGREEVHPWSGVEVEGVTPERIVRRTPRTTLA